MSICIRNWISKIHFIPSMLKSVIEAQSIIVPFPFSLLWRWYRNTSLFFIFNIRIIFWITFIVKILSELSLKIVPIISDAVPFMQPSLRSIKLFLISLGTHYAYLHSSSVQCSRFCEIDDVESYFLVFVHILNTEVKPLRVSSSVRINCHLKIIFVIINYFSKFKITAFKVRIKNKIFVLFEIRVCFWFNQSFRTCVCSNFILSLCVFLCDDRSSIKEILELIWHAAYLWLPDYFQ